MWKKRKYSKRPANIFAKLLLPFFVLLFVVAIFLFARLSFFREVEQSRGFFSVKQVEIEGERLTCVSTDQLKNVSGLIGQNLLLLDSIKTADDLKKKFSCLKSAVISKYFPSKIRIQVSSRQPFAIVATLKEKEASASSLITNIATPSALQLQDFNIVDNEGVAFSKDMNGLNIPKVYIYDSGISLNSPLIILDKLKTLGLLVRQSWIYDDAFVIDLDISGPKMVFRLNDQINIQLASLQLILAEAKIDLKELEFIDLRFDKPIVRIAPKK